MIYPHEIADQRADLIRRLRQHDGHLGLLVEEAAAALAATPAVGGEANEIADKLDQRATVHEYAYNTGSGDTYRSDAKLMREASTALRAQPASPLRGREALKDLAGAMKFILAFYEPGQRHLDTNAWKQAEAIARAAFAKATEVLAQPAPPLRGRDELSKVIERAYFHTPHGDWGAVADSVLVFLSASPPEQPAGREIDAADDLEFLDLGRLDGAPPEQPDPGTGREWQPIETAPSDVDVQLGWKHWHSGEWTQKVGHAQSTKGGWWDGRATHWQPLPDPPPSPTAPELPAARPMGQS